MNKIVNLNEHRRHAVIDDINGNTHTIPLSTLKKIASGKIPVSDLEEHEKIIPTIVKEWLVIIGEDK